MSEAKPTPWSPARDLVTPDPGGLNRALDRAAAPHLAPSAPAPPQPEPAICRHCAAGGCAPAPAFDLIAHLQRQRAFSERTFGPGARTAGVLDHIRKELLEIERDPTDLSEWIDVVLLALDGAWRHGYSPEEIASALDAKQAKNEARTWPDWRTQSMDKAIEHDRGVSAPPAEAKGEMSPPHGIICDRCLAGTPHKRDRHCYSIAQLMEHIAALRTSAREAEERAERVERELDEAQEELDDTGNRVWDEVLAAVRNAWGEDRPYNDSPCELIAKIIDERDEAREQRDDLANEILAGRSDLAAANARAEEAERDTRTAAEACDEALRQRDTERAARVKAEEDVAALKTGSNEVAKLMTALRARLAAAEAEVKRRDEYPHPCLICFGVRPASGKPCACNGTNNVYTAFDYLNAEAARLRLAYDDPTTDATDGAHPAWWRGSDAGVAGAVRIVNEALDGPLPLPGCVGGADLESVRQRVAALRAGAQRLVEAGDAIVEYVAPHGLGRKLRSDWAAAKAALDAPAGSEARR